MTTVMQAFQCDLQPEIPKHPITTHTQADPKQLQATITLRQKKRQTDDRSRNRRIHEVPLIAGCSHFTRKNTRFRAPASSPKQSPCNIMQPFQCDLQPEIPKHPLTTHTQADPKQLQATITLRKKKRQTDRSRNRRTHEVPLIAGCSRFTRKNTRFRAPAPPQNRAHYTAAKKKGKPTAAATAAHVRYLSSPAAAT